MIRYLRMKMTHIQMILCIVILAILEIVLIMIFFTFLVHNEPVGIEEHQQENSLYKNR